MEKINIILTIFIIVYSCKSPPHTTERLPIIYLGIDTTYHDRPIEDYCIHTKKISLIKTDSIIFTTKSSPFAPLDSPYGLHGNEMTYYGKIVNMNDTSVKIKWNLNPRQDVICDNLHAPPLLNSKALI